MILERISQVAHNNVAIEYTRTTTTETITYGELIAQVKQLKNHLLENNIKSVALYCDNTPQWIVIDLACQSANIVFTPIPVFFSTKQIQHLLTNVKPDLLFFDSNFTENLSNERCTYTSFLSPLNELKSLKLSYNSAAEMPQETSKITFTSGSTGEPKGVCLSVENQLNVADALVDKIAINTPTHLSLLSFSTLLENVAGLYAPLLAGGTICIASSNVRGFNGAQLTDLKKLLSFISQSKPQTMILVPELLQVLLLAVSQGWHPPTELEFIAVGGSRVSTKLLNKAKQAGLPVYQGYGLSECASVVSINSKASVKGSGVNQWAGEVLPHLTPEVIEGELVLKGNAFLGYLNMPESWYPQQIYTGDLVTLHSKNIEINGRKKNILINSYGRNISPEWPEAELMASGIFQQVVILGDSQPFCIALLVTASTKVSTGVLHQVLAQVNSSLPDYAQIRDFIQLKQVMTINDGLFTTNGRPKRHAIAHHYALDIEQVYAAQFDENNLHATAPKFG